MIENARIHSEELTKLMYKVWYDPNYQYYFGSDDRWEPWWGNDQWNNGEGVRSWAVLTNDREVIGYISYRWNPALRLANNFGAINFSPDSAVHKLIFGRALYQVLTELFEVFNANTVEWCVVCDNPIETSYDRIVGRFGGKILCTRANRAIDLAGNLHADKIYEITKEEYFATVKKGEQNV